MTTLPSNWGSVFETSLPERSGKLKRKGAAGSLMLVCWVGSVGAGRFSLRLRRDGERRGRSACRQEIADQKGSVLLCLKE